jgi:hypothetical protein
MLRLSWYLVELSEMCGVQSLVPEDSVDGEKLLCNEFATLLVVLS